MRRALLAGIVLAVPLSTAAPQNAGAEGPDAREIRARREASNAAIAKHDTAGIGAPYAPDVVVLSSGSSLIVGREANLRSFAGIFAERPDVVYRRTPREVRVFAPWAMASEAGTWTGSWTAADGRVQIGGRYFAKWRRIGGNWLTESETFVPERCTGSAFCAAAPVTAPIAPAPTTTAPIKSGELRLTYLGNAGWEITDGRRVVLVDPFLTQFRRWRPGGADVAPNGLYVPDTAFIDAHVKRADYILITHGHSDHALDAGYIARRTGATIVGHETAANLARAYDVPDSSLITVIGGEDYDFGDFSLRVVPNIHSALDDKRYYNNGRGIAGTAPRGLRAPLRRVDYQEGGNLAYILRMAGHEVLIMGSMNYIEREMEGLRPDIALIGSNSQRLEIHDYTGRLMRALGYPAVVLPSHADAYGDPNPSPAAIADRRLFQQEVANASPATRFISPTWFEPIVIPPRAAAAAHTVVSVPGIAPLVPAYSEAIRAGGQVFVSGMTGIKPGTQEIVEGGVGPQTRQTLENIRTLLQAAGATMAQVTECTVFLVDMKDYAAMNAEYIAFFPTAPPARATLAVTALPRPAARVEIKCSAVVPD